MCAASLERRKHRPSAPYVRQIGPQLSRVWRRRFFFFSALSCARRVLSLGDDMGTHNCIRHSVAKCLADRTHLRIKLAHHSTHNIRRPIAPAQGRRLSHKHCGAIGTPGVHRSLKDLAHARHMRVVQTGFLHSLPRNPLQARPGERSHGGIFERTRRLAAECARENGAAFVRGHHSRLLRLRPPTLRARKERRTHLRRTRAQHQRRRNTPAVHNAAGCNDGHTDGRDDLRDECHETDHPVARRRAHEVAAMSACFDTLRDDCIHARGLECFRFAHGRRRADDERSVGPQRRDNRRVQRPKGEAEDGHLLLAHDCNLVLE
eukprot:Opistho-1_new@63737